MTSKMNIEEDIKTVNKLVQKCKLSSIVLNYNGDLEAIENILADRERLEKENKKQKEDVQRMQELLDKSDANNTELQKEVETLKNDTYWKGYIDKQNEAIEICKICKYKAKANKYDALVEKAKRLLDYAENYAEKGEFNNGYCQALTNVLKGEEV